MDRRHFLRAAGATGFGALLAACAGEPANETSAGSAGDAGSPVPSTERVFDPVGRVTDAEQTLSVLAATYEQLAGPQAPFAFGVRDIDDAPVEDAELTVYVVPEAGDPKGPFAARAVEDVADRDGLYLADVPFPEPGMTSVVVVTGDERRAGSATIPVTTAETSAFPAPSDAAPVVATPTFAAPLGAEKVCTQDPPCGMHDVSLDEALQSRRPVVLQFATPAYCQTAVCGPSVAVLDQVRQEGEWGDTVFIHCEIYEDAGQELLEAVSEWNLPSEPWIYAIGADGKVITRSDGVLLTLPDQVERVVSMI